MLVLGLDASGLPVSPGSSRSNKPTPGCTTDRKGTGGGLEPISGSYTRTGTDKGQKKVSMRRGVKYRMGGKEPKADESNLTKVIPITTAQHLKLILHQKPLFF